jgi:hypothetical protein
MFSVDHILLLLAVGLLGDDKTVILGRYIKRNDSRVTSGLMPLQ